MNFENYIKERTRIFSIQDANKECLNLLWASNSLGGEVGEFQNMVKKIYRDHGGVIPEKLLEKMELELGDQFWYMIFVLDIIDYHPMKFLENYEYLMKPNLKYDSIMKISNAMGARLGKFQAIVDEVYVNHNGILTELIEESLRLKLTRVLRYWFLACNELQLNPFDVIENNMIKLKNKYGVK